MIPFDTAVLGRYLDQRLPGGLDGELRVSLLAGGRSNPTYEIEDASRSWVLRRPPFGSVLPTAHDMGREYRVLSALCDTDVPVPRPLVMCEDAEIIGAPFFVMEKVGGVTLRNVEDTTALSASQRAELADRSIDTLAALHRIDPADVGLSDWGRPEGYLERQLTRWSKQWAASATTAQPQVDELLSRLGRDVPKHPVPGIIHGDYKIDNLMVSRDDPTQIVALLDWEMSTLGDTFTDLGLLLSFWDRPGEPFHPLTRGMTALEGFPDHEHLLERYAMARGTEVPDIEWYLVFIDVKIAVIFEGIHARHLRGETIGEGFDGIGEMVSWLLARALERAATSSIPPLRRAPGTKPAALEEAP